MKLIEFTGKKIRGYLNVKIKFYEDLNFLIGTNGSGKTTVLNLIEGLLRPSYQILDEIDYAEIELHLKNKDQEDVFITSKKLSEEMIMQLRYGENEPIESVIGIEYKRHHRFALFSTEEVFNDSSVVKQIKKINEFLYLGVDRHFYDFTNKPFDSDILKNDRKKEFVSELDMSLKKVQDMSFLAIRKSNARISTLSEMFKAEILKKSFSFVNDISYGDDEDLASFSLKLHEQQGELNAIVNTYKMSNIAASCNLFFSELESVIAKIQSINKEESLNEEKVKLLLLFYVNKSILSKINEIVALGKKNAEAILKSQENITRFVQSVNIFLKETNKHISVNQLGEIIVHLPNDQKRTIFDLSSGEKHLVIILAYLAFCDESSFVFVVDEPELSLHIAWQNIFVDAVQKANPCAQLIFATHAPSIIAKKSRESKCIDLSEKIWEA